MKKILVATLTLAGALAQAQEQPKGNMLLRFPDGAQILFTDRPCQLGDGKFQDLKSALVMPSGSGPRLACWAFNHSRQAFEVVLDDGTILVYQKIAKKEPWI